MSIKWPALYKDAEKDDVHVLDKPLFRKITYRPVVLIPNHLLDLQRMEMRSVDTGLRLWPKVVSLVLTTKDFGTGCAYHPDVWTTRQRHGFHDLKVSLSEPRLRDKEVRCMRSL